MSSIQFSGPSLLVAFVFGTGFMAVSSGGNFNKYFEKSGSFFISELVRRLKLNFGAVGGLDTFFCASFLKVSVSLSLVFYGKGFKERGHLSRNFEDSGSFFLSDLGRCPHFPL